MYRDRRESIMSILCLLLEKSEKVSYRRKLQGYGLYDSQFDKFSPECTRRIFNHSKNELLEKKYITKLKTRGEQKQYYSITPLGICYLCSISEVDKHQYIKMLDFLKFFYKNNSLTKTSNIAIKIKTMRDVWELVEKYDEPHMQNSFAFYFELALEGIKIIDKRVELSYTDMHANSTTSFAKYFIKNDEIQALEIPPRELLESEFYYEIAEYIIYSFFYTLIIGIMNTPQQTNIIKLLKKKYSKTSDKPKKREYMSRIRLLNKLTQESTEILNSFDKSILKNGLEFSEKLQKKLNDQFNIIKKNEQIIKQHLLTIV